MILAVGTDPFVQNAPSIQWMAAGVASLVAAAIDLRSRRIPNWLTGSVFLIGVAWVVAEGGVRGLTDGLAGCLIMAAPYVALFLLTPTAGAGDAKLMGALGMWLGMRNGVVALVAVTTIGALLGIAFAQAKHRASGVFSNMLLIVFGLVHVMSGRMKWNQADKIIPDSQALLPVPYGLSIFAGICTAAAICVHWPARNWI
jgi:prepilin peptidase CpaA